MPDPKDPVSAINSIVFPVNIVFNKLHKGYFENQFYIRELYCVFSYYIFFYCFLNILLYDYLIIFSEKMNKKQIGIDYDDNKVVV